MTDREKAGQPPRFSWGEAATIAPFGAWVGLALLAAMVLPLKT